MKLCKSIAIALAVAILMPFTASASTGFTQSDTLNSLDVGKELKDGKVYVVDDLGAIITALPTGNALRVADGATVVIYIPKGKALKAYGGDASGTTGAGAGIEVPATSTLIVTGGGELVARGGDASGGTNGGNGGDGVIIDESGHTYDEWGHAGAGGNGGNGGGGAGAGIGGAGGNGGNGGSGAGWTWYDTDYDFDHDGVKGNDGGKGGDSNAGTVYLLGSLSASATGGSASSSAGSSGSTGSIRVEHWFMGYSYRACGGGGGGGGGSGSGAYGFGAGGVGGGGGGGGGCGATYQVAQGQDDDNSHGGSGGGGGGAVSGSGSQSGGANHWGVTGGAGGYGDSKGSTTSSGSVFKDSGVSVSGTYPSLSSASTHSAIEYTLCFDDSHRVDSNLTVRLGYALPAAPMPPERPGWAFNGWFTEEYGGGTQYYNADCSVALSLDEYAVVGDLTLYASWTLTDPAAADTIAINGVGLVGGVTQTGDGWHYDGGTGYVQLTTEGKRYVVTGKDPAGEFSLYTYNTCTVVMSNLTINASANASRPPLETKEGTSSTLLLEGANILYGPADFPAIFIRPNSSLTIGECSGLVTAYGGKNAAGIGGVSGTTSGTLNIQGGTITAYGGDYGAGIGGSKTGSFGTINISGGKVTATGGDYGTGIGGGALTGTATCIISGGTVVAQGGVRGAGIGGGYMGSGVVKISGGTVSAKGGGNGAGIGGGSSSIEFSVEISGGSVWTQGGGEAAGIGSGYNGTGGPIEISGGVVTAIGGGRYSAGIGAGDAGSNGFASGVSIVISGGIVTATSDMAAGIGPGDYAACGAIAISGGTVYASTGDRRAKPIGESRYQSASSVTITGGAIYVNKDDINPAPKDRYDNYVFPVDLDIGLPNSKVTMFELGYRQSGFENIYTNDKGILRIWLASSVNTYGIILEMEDGSQHYFCFSIDETGKVTEHDYIVVNGMIVPGGNDQHGSGWDYKVDTGVMTLTEDTTLAGVSTNGEFRIVVADDAVKNLTLQNLKLLARNEKYASALAVSNATCTVTLAGDNILAAKGQYAAGLEVVSNCVLTVKGDGSLAAFGGKNAAGIGSRGGFPPPGKITIESGTIVAQGGEKAAGIGGGSSSTLDRKDNIVISGGIVTATGGTNAAGIGAGNGKCTLAAGAVRIAGGTVVATGDSASVSDFVKSLGNTLETTGNDYTLVIDGGSVIGATGRVSPRPTDSTSNTLYSVTITGLTPGVETKISSFSGDIPSSYTLDGIHADASGSICLWLPPTNQTRVIQINGKYFEAVYPYENNPDRPPYTVNITLDAASSASDTPSEEVVVDDETRHLVLLPGFAPGETVTLAGLESAGVTVVMMDAIGRGFFYLPDGEYDFTANGYDASVTVEGSPATVSYAIGVSVNNADIGGLAGDGWSFNISSGQLLISDIGPYAISGTRADGKISVLASTSGLVRFDSLALDTSSVAGRTPFEIAPGATVTLELFGENTLKGGDDCAAMQVPDTATLDVLGGEGTLNAIGGENGAGIGGGKDMAVGSIQIAGSTITAEGGKYAAGIGGGYKGTGSSVAISGGEITAVGGEGAAGIGAGMQGSKYTASGDIVDISGGLVRVAAGSHAAALGCSNFGSCGAVTISGGTILELYDATLYLGRHNNARAYAESVTILGGSVRAEVDKIDPAPSNGVDNVYCVTLAWCKPNTKVENIVGLPGDYGANDLYADADGKIYIWLPDGEYEFDIGFIKYSATVSGADVVASSSHPDEPTGVTVNGVDAWECGGEGWTYSAFTSQLELSAAGPYLLSGTNETGKVRVRVEADASVTLSNLCLKATANRCTPFAIASNMTAKVWFTGTNTLRSGRYCAALELPGVSDLEIGGDGWLYAQGGASSEYWGCPAIGISDGMYYASGRLIKITGGNFVALSGAVGTVYGIDDAVVYGGSIYTGRDPYYDHDVLSFYAKTPDGANAGCIVVPGLEPGSPVEFAGLPGYYNASNIVADAEGKAYIYLKVTYDGEKTYFTANGQLYKVVVLDSTAASTAEKGDFTPLENLSIDSISVNADNVSLIVSAEPDGWMADFSQFLRVRAGETLPLEDGGSAIIPAGGVTITPNGDGTATVTVPDSGATARFFRIEKE